MKNELKKEPIYEGKAKKLFKTDNPEVLLIEYKDSLTAFNAQKRGSFAGKGKINRDIAALIFNELHQVGINTHFIKSVGDNEMQVKRVSIIPLEVVVRNVLAGSTAKKLGRPEGENLSRPLVEFYYKDDLLGDPFLSDDQVLVFGFASETELRELKKQALAINTVLYPLFASVQIRLVDFKLEFGAAARGEIILADEITPDCCRLWDMRSGEKLDKDRFRRDLGNIEESYRDVLHRLHRRLDAGVEIV